MIRCCWLFALLTVCGDRPAPSRTPTPQAPANTAPASPPGKAFCFPPGAYLLDRFEATDDTATLCMKGDGPRICATASLATGAFTVADPATLASTLVAAPVLSTRNGTRELRVAKNDVSLVDTATGRARKLPLADPSFHCAEVAGFLGNTVYATANPCNHMPRTVGYLFTADVVPIGGKLEYANLRDVVPFHVGGDRWAFHSSDSENVLVVDVATGTQTILAPMTYEQAGACCSTRVRSPAAPFAKTPRGRLVTITAMFVVIDPDRGKVDGAWMLPVCAP